ncbi:MAG: glycosyltransferase family 39 protein [Holosporaceae bacterium]|jgi:4-amino-4-deoxy-L-arabinose transferase-like glycosyltransferase|nr:glycosyltransferase family 39 protein [Holosporaceae bacterium]
MHKTTASPVVLGSQNRESASPSRGNDEKSLRIKFLLLLAVVFSIFFSYEIGNRRFADPDEGRYVEIPREMVVTGDYVSPKLNGLKYFEKPPLFYWMQAGVIKTFGINETSMRLWTVAFAVLGCLAVFLVGALRYSNLVGLASAGILATNIFYYAHSRLIILDLVASVLMSLELWLFFLAFARSSRPSEKLRKKLTIAMCAVSALTCLTKGLIGVVLPGIVVLPWMTITKSWSKLKEIFYLPGILVFLAIFLPWHILIARRNDDFLYYYFVVEHFLRYLLTIHNRYKPAWFFIPILLAGMLPWTGFSLVAIKNSFKKALSKDSESVFLLCWIFGIFIFYSFSNSKLIPYILPLIPPIALITGKDLVESRNWKTGVWLNVTLFAIAAAAYFVAKPQISDVLQDSDAVMLIKFFAGLAIAAALVLIASLYFKNSRSVLAAVYFFIAANMMWTINKATVVYQEMKKPSTKQFAELIRMNRNKDDLVFCYKRYYQDFPVYLNSTVGVVDFVGELEFGANADPKNDKLISEEAFWKLWNSSKKRIFLLLSREHYREVFTAKNPTHRVLDFNKYFVAITNK